MQNVIIMFCINPAHGEEPLNLLCIDANCDTPGLICSQCQLQSHQKHNKMATKQFLCTLTHSLDKSGQGLLIFSAQIDKSTMQLRTLLYSLAQGNKSKLQTVDLSLSVYISNLRNEIKSTNAAIKEMVSLEANPNVVRFNQLFRKHFYRLMSGEENMKRLKGSLLESVIKRWKEDTEKIRDGVEVCMSSMNCNFARALSFLSTKPEQNISFKFSETFKGKSIKLVNPYTAVMEVSGSERMLLLQPSLQGRSSSLRWRIKIIKKKSWIGVGMCHLNLIKDVNFQFQYTETGHGNYLISSNGYSWSSLKPQHNSKSEAFTFDTGDIIELKFEPKARLLEFQKVGSENTYKLEFEFKQGDPLYPAVNLTGTGDSVEIV